MALIRPTSAVLAFALAALAACAAPPGTEDLPPQRVGVEYGVRRWSGTGWDDFGDDDQTTLGLVVAAEEERRGLFGLGLGLGIDFGFTWSEGRGDLATRTVSVDTYETYLGWMKAVKLWEDRFRIEVGWGGSATLLSAHDQNAANGDRYDRDIHAGVYGRVGVNFRLGSRVWLGVGGRFVRGGEANVFEGALAGDFEQLTVTLSTGQ